ncbi:DUF5687 family protein [Flavobacterium silvaticum]|uniref:Uncharacterized protein n=1 Tax=Flavobacterium silvaticum TaxID=1852020 RepID=A0A972FMC0_9FLAO|nr:DUF5687 family protein [Flavobacterium silvaticum]NMH28368.1 hypothetical protein [Flavobacterium silvaticum]
MFRLFAGLEWKSFVRSKAFAANLVLKILMGLAAVYFSVCFLFLGVALYFGLEEAKLEPLETVNRYLLYFLFFDLTVRYFLQKMPVLNIKPMLPIPIPKKIIVHYALSKCVFSFFNLYQAFIFVPFTVVLLLKSDVPVVNVLLWHVAVFALVFSNNFINVLINSKDSVFYPVLAIVGLTAVSHYYGWFDATLYTQHFFNSLSDTYFMFLVPCLFFGLLYYASFNYFRKRLHLDTGLASKTDLATTENLTWLNQFGSMGTFLKNDIRLLRRNKRSRTTLFMSVAFIFYGLLFYTGSIEVYSSPGFQVFAGIFVSGGFLFTFGQFVPSWDSAYYQLMMSQNISYKQYLASKWWLMVIATCISTVIASFYIIFGWKIYLLIVFGAIYNIGVNSYLVLWAGAYVKTPIDLTSSKRAFGDKQAFNFKTLLISLPKLLVPVLLYTIGYFAYGSELGLLLLALAGIAGFLFRDKMFNVIEKVYRTEKYKTIEAYKEKA